MKKGMVSLIRSKPCRARPAAQCCAKTSKAAAGCHD